MQYCSAPERWYCSPLNQLVICPQNWYCPGGSSSAIHCPDGKWSAVGSAYPDDCVNDMNAQLAVVISFILVLLALFVCIWYASLEWLPYTCKPAYEYSCYTQPYSQPSKYGATAYTADIKIVHAQSPYYPKV